MKLKDVLRANGFPNSEIEIQLFLKTATSAELTQLQVQNNKRINAEAALDGVSPINDADLATIAGQKSLGTSRNTQVDNINAANAAIRAIIVAVESRMHP